MSTRTFPWSAGAESVGAAGLSEVSSAKASSARVPWYLWVGMLSVNSSTFGLEWDIAWHDSIGRDTFWTPAHMMIYLGGILSAIVCAYLVLATTFGRSQSLRANSVSVYRFRAPLGCFLATWGGLAMLVAAFFDNWWHEAYGLDVAIVTLPHTLLLTGVDLVSLGFVLLTASAMNRAKEAGAANFKSLQRLLVYLCGLILWGHLAGISALVERPWLHAMGTYKIIVLASVALLTLLSQASGYRWALTSAAGLYTLVRIATTLIFPLFPATPRVGPVLFPLTHLMPIGFPILIIVPAFALDLLRRRTGGWKPWQDAIACGVTFVAALVPVEWFFADFLMTPAAANRFFGTMYFDYWTRPVDRLPHFARAQSGWPLMHGALVVIFFAILTSWIGLRAGRWVQTVQR